MQFATRRSLEAAGYLEFIWRTDVERPAGATPQAIAYITDAVGSTPARPRYVGCYGIHSILGPTVAAVKEQLFALLEDGQ